MTGILIGLFWMAFLAATILPLSSEAALSGALLAGVPPGAALLAATLGNALGSLSTYGLGRCGKLEWLTRFCRITPEELEQNRARVTKYGGIAAVLCFLPLLGDGLAAALGYMRYPPGRFFLLMTAGKACRYAVWCLLHQELFDHLAK